MWISEPLGFHLLVNTVHVSPVVYDVGYIIRAATFLSVAQRESLGECTVPSSVARLMLRNRGIHCDRKDVLQKDHVDASRDAPVQLRYG